MNFIKIILILFFILTNSISLCCQNKIDSMLQLLKTEKEDSIIWLLNMRLSVNYSYKNIDSALYHCKAALSIAEKTKSPYMLFHNYNEMGNCYFDFNNFSEAINYYQKSYEIAVKSTNLDSYSPLNNIANIYSDQNKYDEAKKIRKTIIKEYESQKQFDSIGLARGYLNLGVTEFFTNKYADAEIAYKKSLKYNQKKDIELHLICINNLTSLYRKLKQYSKAQNLIEENTTLFENNEDRRTLILHKTNKAMILLETGELDKSLEIFTQLENTIPSNMLNERQQVLKSISDLYEQKGNFQSSLKYNRLYSIVTDSININRYDSDLVKYQSKIDLIEKERALQKTEIELVKHKNTQRKWQLAAIVILSTFLLSLLSIYYFNNIKKQKQKIAEIAKEKEHQKEVEMNELKAAFFANISHELKTPITLIKGPLQEIQNLKNKTIPENYLKIMTRQTDRLQELVTQLLDLTKLDSGSMQLKTSQFELNAFIQKTYHDFLWSTNKKNIEFQFNPAPFKYIIDLDYEKLQNILTNIISNAIKFTNEGGKITISLTVENDIQINVKDTGIGIEKEKVQNIFDRFYSSDGQENIRGSGIGLTLSKELTELMGGKIIVDSEINKGSTFSIIFPIEKIIDKQNIDNTIMPSTNEIIVDINLTKAKLLLVEDNEDMSFFISNILEKDWEIITASNGEEGFQKSITEIPDIILSDIMMPKMNGYQLSEKLKKHPNTTHIPIVLLSAKSERDDKIEGLKFGAIDYLTKPFDNEELILKLKNILEYRKTQQDIIHKKLYTVKIQEEKIESDDDVFIQKLKTEIEKSYTDEFFSIESLSSNLGLSRSQLYRKISALTGKSPIEILKEYRLNKAKEFLEKKSGNISEISYKVGFSSPSYFIKCFKDQFGITPSKYYNNEPM